MCKQSLITKNFDNPVLYDPASINSKHNRLRIITAFTDCERISTHLIGLSDGIKANRYVPNISVDIILGMTKSSLSMKKHTDICRLITRLKSAGGKMPDINCFYIRSGTEVHSKIYLWGTNSVYDLAYCGSLNYTMNAFYKRRESVSLCDAAAALEYYNELMIDTVSCLDKSAAEQIKGVTNNKNNNIEPEEADYSYYNLQENPIASLEVSLLTSKGDVGYGSGVNWGIRPNGTKRNPNQAYIPYNRENKKAGFFPDRINPNDINCPIFKVCTKDFGTFHMRMAQSNNKALHSAESNAILGEWIRKRLGLQSGCFITKQMMENYGKTYVTFRKYSDGTYLLDY